MAEQERLLSVLEKSRSEDQRKLESAEDRLRSTELSIAYMRGQLAATEQERDEARQASAASAEQLQTREKELYAVRGELGNVRTELQSTRTVLLDTRGELQSTRENLAETRAQLVKTEEQQQEQARNLQYTRSQLELAERKLRNDAVSSYSASVRKLKVHIVNDRFLGKLQTDRTLYLPQVNIGGKVYLIGELSSVLGLDAQSSGYSQVSELSFRSYNPMDNTGESVLNEPVITLAEYGKSAVLIPVEHPNGEVLKPVSFDGLKKRGTQNLTLFKASSYGNQTADLEGRCSLDLSDNGNGQNCMIVRNSIRNASELAAEPGDFILSKEGDFIGVIVSVSSSSFGQKQEARCYILPENFIPENTSRKIRILKKEGQNFYEDFVEDLSQVLKDIEVRISAE